MTQDNEFVDPTLSVGMANGMANIDGLIQMFAHQLFNHESETMLSIDGMDFPVLTGSAAFVLEHIAKGFGIEGPKLVYEKLVAGQELVDIVEGESGEAVVSVVGPHGEGCECTLEEAAQKSENIEEFIALDPERAQRIDVLLGEYDSLDSFMEMFAAGVHMLRSMNVPSDDIYESVQYIIDLQRFHAEQEAVVGDMTDE